MTQLLVVAGIVAALGFGFWLALMEARRRGRAEAERDAEAEARKVETEMTDIVLKPREPGETERRLDDGTF